ncbi:uncharacterized protein LOC126285054 [Schistocerca gregaria]|uniref:uncharacterized protein LOC126285054 n=1 Tax=Schistocerca gregaria TaxID=7010 RepID=UPI00211F2F01|nr:uncharacterized protein LOC126285054 [Schistocerca gregaria]
MKQPFSCKQTGGETVKITLSSLDDHRAVMGYAGDAGLPTYTFPVVRPAILQVILRGVIRTLPNDVLKQQLQKMGFAATTVEYHRMPGTNKLSGLRLVILPDSTDHRKIFQVTRLMGLVISAERLRRTRGNIQCFRCQGFNHVARHCTFPYRCVKCAGDHDFRSCPAAKETPAKCCLCGGDHTANFRSCPAHKAASRRRRGLPPLPKTARRRRSEAGGRQRPAAPPSSAPTLMEHRAAKALGPPPHAPAVLTHDDADAPSAAPPLATAAFPPLREQRRPAAWARPAPTTRPDGPDDIRDLVALMQTMTTAIMEMNMAIQQLPTTLAAIVESTVRGVLLASGVQQHQDG